MSNGWIARSLGSPDESYVAHAILTTNLEMSDKCVGADFWPREAKRTPLSIIHIIERQISHQTSDPSIEITRTHSSIPSKAFVS